jgi:hypothetical protein
MKQTKGTTEACGHRRTLPIARLLTLLLLQRADAGILRRRLPSTWAQLGRAALIRLVTGQHDVPAGRLAGAYTRAVSGRAEAAPAGGIRTTTPTADVLIRRKAHLDIHEPAPVRDPREREPLGL